MTTEDKIRDEKLKYGINREAGKISALLSGKTDKYEYLTGEEIFPDQGRIIEKVYLFYLRKSFWKTNTNNQRYAWKKKENNWGCGRNINEAFTTLSRDHQLKSIGYLFSKQFLTAEAKDELEKLKK